MCCADSTSCDTIPCSTMNNLSVEWWCGFWFSHTTTTAFTYPRYYGALIGVKLPSLPYESDSEPFRRELHRNRCTQVQIVLVCLVPKGMCGSYHKWRLKAILQTVILSLLSWHPVWCKYTGLPRLFALVIILPPVLTWSMRRWPVCHSVSNVFFTGSRDGRLWLIWSRSK